MELPSKGSTAGRLSEDIPADSITKRFFRALCPCFASSRGAVSLPDNTLLNKVQTDNTQLEAWTQKVELESRMTSSRSKPNYKSTVEFRLPSKVDQDIGPQRSFSSDVTTLNFPVTKFRQMQVMVVGDCKRKMLAKITATRIVPSAEAVERTKTSLNCKRDMSLFSNPEMESYWKNRYMAFEKFDRGVKINKDSWSNTIPQAVAEYIAVRAKCITILDGLCGVGSTAIKFANTCHTVIVNDPDTDNLDCLDNNVTIYQASNLVRSNKQFLELENIHPDIVFLCPSMSCTKDLEILDLNPSQMFKKPSLQDLISKALSLSDNLVLLLPPNTNIEQLGVIYHTALFRAKPLTSVSCSIEVEKIYFNRKMKYISVYYGPMVNRQMKIKDQLTFIYKLLNEGRSTGFKYKNLVKHIRSRYGMINLLLYTSDCLKYEKDTVIERFCQMIKVNNLLPDKPIQTFCKPDGLRLNRLYTLEEQKCEDPQEEEDVVEQSQRTQSFATTQNENEHSFKNHQLRDTIFVSGKERHRMTMDNGVPLQKPALLRSALG